MTKPSKQSIIGTVIAIVTCATMVFGGVWHASAETEKIKSGLEKLDDKVKHENVKIQETKDDVKSVKEEVKKVKETCNDIKREQAVQALEQKHMKELLIEIKKKLDEKD
jgi:outer membrane murein-binding lipoprotein Lpp